MATGTIQSVERAVDVLRAVARRGGGPARLTDVTVETGLTKSTAHRLLLALVRAGLLEQDADSGQFLPGFDLLTLGAAAGNRYGLVEIAAPNLRRLADRTGDTVYLSVREGDETVVVERMTGPFPIKALSAEVGERRPLGVGVGSLAIFAFLDEETVARVVADTAARANFAGFDEADLAAMVLETRAAGFAFAASRVIEGMSAVGVPVRDRAGAPIASLSVAAISDRLAADRREHVAAWLAEEAQALEERLAATGVGAQRLRQRSAAS